MKKRIIWYLAGIATAVLYNKYGETYVNPLLAKGKDWAKSKCDELKDRIASKKGDSEVESA